MLVAVGLLFNTHRSVVFEGVRLRSASSTCAASTDYPTPMHCDASLTRLGQLHRVVVLRVGRRSIDVVDLGRSDRREGRRVEKALDDVARDGRHIVVEVVLECRANPANGSGREHRSTVRGLEEDQVALRPGPAVCRVIDDCDGKRLQLDILDRRPERLRRGQIQRVPRHAVGGVVAVDLEAAGAPVHLVDPVVAEDLALLGPLEDPRGAWIGPVLELPVGAGAVEDHAGHLVAEHRSCMATGLDHQAAALAVLQIAVGDVVEVATLHHARQLGVVADAPEPAIGARVDETAALRRVGGHVIEHLSGDVLRMGRADHRTVLLQQLESFGIYQLVGDDVVRDPLVLEEGGDVGVLDEVVGHRPRFHVEIGPQARAVGEVAPVDVVVVDAPRAVLQMGLVELAVRLVQVLAGIVLGREDHDRDVGIRKVVIVREPEGQLGAGLALGRRNEEGHVFGELALLQTRGVDAARQVFGDGVGEV